MMKRLILSIVFVAAAIGGFAQDDSVLKKLSVTTQMFLNELKGELSFTPQSESTPGLVLSESMKLDRLYTPRLFAAPEEVNGKSYIATYLRLNDSNSVSDLEALGVQVQSKFNNGLVTALIPIDKILEVAAIANVKSINVSKLMRPTTFKARQQTNTDDLLIPSLADAAGLSHVYDGSGVVLGVIDTGIDFQHIAFKDMNGNSRIKKAYVYNGSSATEYDNSNIGNATTDDNTGDHGTHTSSTAGGSSVIVNGTDVTVTDNHASATYGGMAPGADLYLAGIKSLSSTYLDNAVKKIVDYADAQGKPVVVSNSWGSQIGPHDGTGDVATVYSTLFGDDHPNHIALFAASNDGGKSKDGEGGGYHVSKAGVSKANPLTTILRSATYVNTDAGYYYYGIIANAWARTTDISRMAIKVMVLNSNTGELLYTSDEVTDYTQLSTPVDVLGLVGISRYFSGSLYVYYDQITSDKTQIILYSSDGFTSRGTSSTARNGYDPYYLSNYTLAIQIYPVDESQSGTIDVWGGNYSYFTGDNWRTTSGFEWTEGSDDMCVSDEATMPDAISIGAYVSSKSWTDYTGTTRQDDHYTNGDIAYFSSYATAQESPTGLQYPWITAPGARLIAGVNHNHTTSVDSYSYYGSEDLVVNNANSPYAAMEGTSMATPTAAGIVAVWLQAAAEVGKTYTVNQLKEVMRKTAIHDKYTDNTNNEGPNYTHFGQGKIDALAGLKEILKPEIAATPTDVEFTGYATRTYTQTINVKGYNLSGDINATLADANNVYSIDVTEPIARAAAMANGGVDVTITWSPQLANVGTPTDATITLTSTGADAVTVNISGTAQYPAATILPDKESLSFFAEPGSGNTPPSQTITVNGRFLTANVTATLGGTNADMFSVSPAALDYANVNSDNGAELTVTFNATTTGNYTATLTLSSTNAESVVISLSGEVAEGGKANTPYLNIKQYLSIDIAAGEGNDAWNKSKVNPLYVYTQYPSEGVAWLTMPVYGAFISVHDSPKAQDWITTDVSTESGATRDEVSWSASDIYKGSSAYFSSTPYVLGSTSDLNVLSESVTFMVTNTTGVKLLGKNNSWLGSSSHPISLTVTELTDNLAETSTTYTQSNGNESANVNLSILSLDPTKIYKVVASEERGCLYEIGFRTTLELSPTIYASTSSVTLPSVEIEQTSTRKIKVTGVSLTGNITATAATTSPTGADVFSVSPTTITKANAEGEGEEITVTFAPTAAETTYEGTVTLSSEGATPVVVNLSAESTATSSFFDATIKTLGLSTMFVPFAVEIPYDTYDPDLLGVFIVYDISDRSQLKLARLNGTIPANTGVIIQGNSGTYRFPRATGNVPSLTRDNYLEGFAYNVTVADYLTDKANNGIEGTIYTLQKGKDSYVEFLRYTGDVLYANKAFLFLSNNSNTKDALSLNFGGDTDGIRQIGNSSDSDAWYTIEGVKLNNKPSRKGIYIHQGKRIVVQ